MTWDNPFGLIILAFAWVAYGVVHSLLASLGLKRWVANHAIGLLPAYRLLFNLVALMLLILPLWLMHSLSGDYLWRWSGLAVWLTNGIAVIAILLFLWSMRYYDGQEFIGIRQLHAKTRLVEDLEHLQLSPLHCYVRHPWYTFVLMIIWTRDMDTAWLVSAAIMTLYFILGSRLEENKLLAYHGEAYRQYRQRVPPFIPLPWHTLSADEAQSLEALSRSHRAQTGSKDH